MFDRLHDLELVARLLHPPARERRELLASAEHYAEGYLERLAELPGYVPDDELARRALDSAPISDDPTPVADALATLWDGVDRVGVNESVGHFFGFIPGPALYASAVGDYLSAVTNRYAGITYGAPGAVRVQQSLIRWMGRLVGYPDTAGGDLTSGGSIANLSAIVSARESADLRSRDVEHSCVYLTRHTHHSVRKALKVAGMGDVAVRLLPIDASYRMRPDALEDAVRADLDAGFRPWLVVASAGSTDAGAVDPLPDIAAIAERHQILLHVDAAYGGAFLLCEPGQRALQGIDRSDSVIIDPHKGLFIPFGLGLVLVKHRDAMVRAFSYEADYLQDTASGDGLVPPAALSPEFTRPNRAIRLWLPLTLYGVTPFRAALEEKLLLARYAHETLGATEYFDMGPPPDLSVVTFRCRQDAVSNAGATEDLLRAIHADGRIYLTSTQLGGRFTLRLAILNASTHREHIDRAIDVLTELAASAAS